MRRAQDAGVRRAGELEIVGIAAGALHQRGVFDACDGLAESELGHVSNLLTERMTAKDWDSTFIYGVLNAVACK
jgi:hypothetical protein